MYIDLNKSQKIYTASILNDSPDMIFSSTIGENPVTIEVKDEGSLLFHNPNKYDFIKNIRVYDIENNIVLDIDYRHFYNRHDNCGFFTFWALGENNLGTIGELLKKVKANKEYLAQNKKPLVKRVISRVMSTFSKIIPTYKR